MCKMKGFLYFRRLCYAPTDVDALNIMSLLTFWVSHDMSIGYVVWDRDCKKKKKKEKKKKRSTTSPLKKKVRDLHLEKKNSREFVA